MQHSASYSAELMEANTIFFFIYLKMLFSAYGLSYFINVLKATILYCCSHIVGSLLIKKPKEHSSLKANSQYPHKKQLIESPPYEVIYYLCHMLGILVKCKHA